MASDQNIFEPWQADYDQAAYLMGVAAAALVISPFLGAFKPLSVIGAVLAFLCSIQTLRKGRRRERGILVEQAAIEAIKAILPPNWTLQTDVSAGRVGNIDMLISVGEKTQIVVEIKSYSVEPVRGGRLKKPGDLGPDSDRTTFVQKSERHCGSKRQCSNAPKRLVLGGRECEALV